MSVVAVDTGIAAPRTEDARARVTVKRAKEVNIIIVN
jgi:hypothetical protein